MLVSPRFFKLILAHKINRIKKQGAEFPDIIGATFEKGVAGMTEQGKTSLSSYDKDEQEEFVMQMDNLQFLHPALWFRVYKNLAALKLSWAAELEDPEKGKKFLPT